MDSSLKKNLVNVLSFYSPILISMSVLMFSILSNTIGKALFYIFWLFIATVIRMGISYAINSRNTDQMFVLPEICSLGELMPFSGPTYSTYILCFTFMYFMMPMFITNNVNYILLTFFIIYIVFDIMVKATNQCLKAAPAIIGDIIGGLGFGAALIGLLYSTPVRKYLYTSDTSNGKDVCSMPSKQQFKCNVYKNGELVSSSIN